MAVEAILSAGSEAHLGIDDERRRLALVGECVGALADGLGGMETLGALLAEGARESEVLRRRVMRACMTLVLAEQQHSGRVAERARREILERARAGTAEGLRALADAIESEAVRDGVRAGSQSAGAVLPGMVGALADGMEGLARSGVLGAVVRELERRGVEVRGGSDGARSQGDLGSA